MTAPSDSGAPFSLSGRHPSETGYRAPRVRVSIRSGSTESLEKPGPPGAPVGFSRPSPAHPPVRRPGRRQAARRTPGHAQKQADPGGPPGRRTTRGGQAGGNGATDRRAGGGAVPREPVQRTRRRGTAADHGGLRDLRPRQRGRRRAGAAAGGHHGRGGPAVLPGPQRAGHGARGHRLRPHAQPAPGDGLHRVHRAGLDEHADRRRRGDHQPPCRCCCCPATSSPRGSAARCCRSSSSPTGYDVQVSDAFRPLSRFFERVWRPEQLPGALLGAMRVLTDQAETGAVTIALPQDVQAEAFDWPEELFAKRVWHITRPAPDPAAVARAVEVLRSARKPLIVAGGGVLYSEATEQLRRFADATGIPVADTQAGKGSHPVGARAGRRRGRLHRLARRERAGPGRGRRAWGSAPATATSRRRRKTAFQNPDVRFVNLNVASLDAYKLSAVPLVADARLGLEALTAGLDGPPRRRRLRAGLHRAQGPVERRRGRGLPPRPPAAPGADRDPRRAQRARRPGRRRRPGGRQHARRPADALARAGPEAVPRRVRLLLHGLRGRRCAGRQDGRPGARGVRPGRRRLVPDDGPGDRHRGVRGHQAGAGDRAEPRVLLDRLAVRESSARSGSAPTTATATRSPGLLDGDKLPDRPGRERREPRRRGHPGQGHGRVPRGRGAGQVDPAHRRDPHRERPAGARCPPARAGGTSPSPRCPTSTAPRRPTRPTRATRPVSVPT